MYKRIFLNTLYRVHYTYIQSCCLLLCSYSSSKQQGNRRKHFKRNSFTHPRTFSSVNTENARLDSALAIYDLYVIYISTESLYDATNYLLDGFNAPLQTLISIMVMRWRIREAYDMI